MMRCLPARGLLSIDIIYDLCWLRGNAVRNDRGESGGIDDLEL